MPVDNKRLTTRDAFNYYLIPNNSNSNSNSNSKDTIMIEQLLRAARLHRLTAQASMFMEHFEASGAALPTVGQSVVCLHSIEDTLDQDGFLFAPKPGSVYDVVAAINDEATRDTLITFMKEHGMPQEGIDAVVNHEFTVPQAILIRDRETQQESFTVFPAGQGFVWGVASEGAVSEPMNYTLPEGTALVFSDPTCLGDDFTAGSHYVIEEVKPLCACGEDDCKAHGKFAFVVEDDRGDKVNIMSPVSPFGIFRPVV